MSKNNISHEKHTNHKQECTCDSTGKDCCCNDHKNQSSTLKIQNSNNTDSSSNNNTVSKDTPTQEDSISSPEEEPASILSQDSPCRGDCGCDTDQEPEPDTSKAEKLLAGGCCCDTDDDQDQDQQSDNTKNNKIKAWKNKNKFTFYGTMILIFFTFLHELEKLFNFKIPLDINFIISTFGNHSLHINFNISNLSSHMAEVFLTALPGLIVGIIAVGFLGMIPREFILSIMGSNKGRTQALCRAMLAGVLFDLCNHGLMMVAVTLYRKGAKMSHVMAFLMSSPWNSFSVTIMMFIFLGWKATILFLIVSVIASFIIGFIIDILENNGIVPQNKVSSDIHADFQFVKEAKTGLKAIEYNRTLLNNAFNMGIKGSASVIKWTVFGLLLSAIISTVIPLDTFQEYFGRSFKGFLLVFIVSILLEVCSQGTVPIAGNIFKKAHALGNSFLFLNVGAITNITQILVLNDLTKSKKATAILVIVPLIVIIICSILMNLLM